MHRLVASVSLLALLSACSATPAPAVPATSAAPGTSAPAAAAGPEGGPAAASDAAAGPTAPSTPAGGQAAAPGSTLASGDTREDAHWIQADDYFVARRAYEKSWQTVYVAKMKEPAPKGEKGEALFFLIKDGSEERSAFFYRTRPAVQADLVLGNLLICFDDNKKGKVYGAPRDKDNARPGGWWMARITDLSDLGQGYATLSGSYHCAPGALRAIVK